MLTKGFHKHHIKPKHAGGSDSPENLVLLHPIDHAIAHLVRYKMFGNVRDRWACNWLQKIIDPAVYTEFSVERERAIKERRAVDKDFDAHMHKARSYATTCRKEGYQKAAGQAFAERFKTDADYAKPISESRKRANAASVAVRRNRKMLMVEKVRKLRQQGCQYLFISKETGFSVSMISNIVNGKSYA